MKSFLKISLSLIFFYQFTQAIDPEQIHKGLNTFLDIADFLVKSKHDLAKLKEELQKIPLFVKGCKIMKATDARYPDIRVGNTKISLRDYYGEPIPKLDETGKQVLDENGKVIYQKLTADCDNFKDVFSGVSKSLDYLQNTILGSSDKPNALFIRILEVLGLQNKISSVSAFSDTISGMKSFIDRIDKVMKIPPKTQEQASTQAQQSTEVKK